jgi:hypothetical protein
MEKVLKVNVYLDDIKDYKGMNEVFKGRFGKNPPGTHYSCSSQGRRSGRFTGRNGFVLRCSNNVNVKKSQNSKVKSKKRNPIGYFQ